jgi:hypothetical protein
MLAAMSSQQWLGLPQVRVFQKPLPSDSRKLLIRKSQTVGGDGSRGGLLSLGNL